MCGLVGFVTTEPSRYTFDKKKFMKQALFADTFRGADSTGICLVDPSDNINIYKRALSGSDFVEAGPYDKLLRRTDPRIAMGHNRAATQGAIRNSTAHPFAYGKIILAHNGTLTNHRALKDGNKFPVDSEYIAYSFNKFGVDETLEQIRGAFALTWYDSESKLFNVVRNDERELVYGINKSKGTLMYASESGLLDWIATRNSLELDDNCYYEFESGKHYTINPKDLAIDTREVKFAPKYVTHYVRGTNRPANTKQGSSTDSTKDTTKHERFKDSLGNLGLEMNETIFMKYVSSDDTTAYFELESWYPTPQNSKVVVRLYLHNPMYIEDHKDSMFSARVRGCKHVKGTDDYMVFVDSPESEDEEGVHEKKPERKCSETLLPGPNNISLYKGEWYRRTSGGCDVCNDTILEKDAAWVRWTVAGKPVCLSCVQEHYTGKTEVKLEAVKDNERH